MAHTREQSIIEVIRDPAAVTWADFHIAKVKGLSGVKRNKWYRNTETGELYSHIAGGIAWPGAQRGHISAAAPGFAVVVVADKTEADDEMPCIRAVAEVEHEDIYKLAGECVKLRERWGYWQDEDILHEWWGDFERFMTLTGEIDTKLEKRDGEGNGFYVTIPIDFEHENAFEIYLRRILSCLLPDEQGNKMLELGPCIKLGNYLQGAPADASKRSADEFPAIAALGFVLHSLKVLEPWTQNVDDEETIEISTMELAAREREQEIRRLMNETDSFSETEEENFANYGFKDPVNTIPGG